MDYNGVEIERICHSAFKFKNKSFVVYIDPYEIKQGSEIADVIIITHDHFDHCSPNDVAKIKGTKTIIVTVKSAASKLSGTIRTVIPGDKINANGIDIEAVAAYNVGKKFHPHENKWIGVIIKIGDVRIYHAGDTDLIPEMDKINCDVALLPVSGTYVMNPDEAIKAASKIKANVFVPMHYGKIVGTKEDAKKFCNGIEKKCFIL